MTIDSAPLPRTGTYICGSVLELPSLHKEVKEKGDVAEPRQKASTIENLTVLI